MSKTLYLECYSGISGDMTVGALLDLGADENVLMESLRSLPLDEFDIAVTRVKKSGLDACDFHVILDEVHDPHDHDMEYLHGHEHPHDYRHCNTHDHPHDQHSQEHTRFHDAHEHSQEHAQFHDAHEHGQEHARHHACEHRHGHTRLHGHEHSQEHTHFHDHEGCHAQGCSLADEHTYKHSHTDIEGHKDGRRHSHVHRGLPEIREIIQKSGLSRRAKDTALRIFQILAEAEAKAHGMPAEQVHFHEVGAVDSIVDIAAVAVCLDNLDITDIIVGELCEGRGTIRCQHGVIPVPVPAVVHIAAAHHLTLHMTEMEGELITPTGAAIVAAVKTADKLPSKYQILQTGMGAGKRDYKCAGVLRAMLIEPEKLDTQKINQKEADTIWHLESNIDDCSGEAMGYVMNRLMEEGARDVYYTPVYMKKNRPAYELNVICKKEQIERLEEIIFQNTTTIGIRRMEMERTVLNRELREIDTSLGKVQVKICKIGTDQRAYPEYDSVVRLCREHKLSYQEVWQIVSREAAI